MSTPVARGKASALPSFERQVKDLAIRRSTQRSYRTKRLGFRLVALFLGLSSLRAVGVLFRATDGFRLCLHLARNGRYQARATSTVLERIPNVGQAMSAYASRNGDVGKPDTEVKSDPKQALLPSPGPHDLANGARFGAPALKQKRARARGLKEGVRVRLRVGQDRGARPSKRRQCR